MLTMLYSAPNRIEHIQTTTDNSFFAEIAYEPRVLVHLEKPEAMIWHRRRGQRANDTNLENA
jgi:hypothetical protein